MRRWWRLSETTSSPGAGGELSKCMGARRETCRKKKRIKYRLIVFLLQFLSIKVILKALCISDWAVGLKHPYKLLLYYFLLIIYCFTAFKSWHCESHTYCDLIKNWTSIASITQDKALFRGNMVPWMAAYECSWVVMNAYGYSWVSMSTCHGTMRLHEH